MVHHFLTLEEVQSKVPSALAETHDGRRSNRYNFVSSRQIIESMAANNWGLISVAGPKTRTPARTQFGLHKMEFQARDSSPITDPRRGAIYPRMIVMNSHNGTSNFSVHAGLLCMVCSNGLVVSAGSIGEFRVRHNNQFNIEDAFAAIQQFRENLNPIVGTIEKWDGVQLSNERAIEFATRAARIRWDNAQDILPDYASLLQPRRQQDHGGSLWARYNVVQENLIRGGYSRNNRKVREMNQIQEMMRVNRELWDLGIEFANNN